MHKLRRGWDEVEGRFDRWGGTCNWRGSECDQARAEGSVYCPAHRDKRLAENRAYREKKRAKGGHLKTIRLMAPRKKRAPGPVPQANPVDRSDGIEGSVIVLERAIRILRTKTAALESAYAILTGETKEVSP